MHSVCWCILYCCSLWFNVRLSCPVQRLRFPNDTTESIKGFPNPQSKMWISSKYSDKVVFVMNTNVKTVEFRLSPNDVDKTAQWLCTRSFANPRPVHHSMNCQYNYSANRIVMCVLRRTENSKSICTVGIALNWFRWSSQDWRVMIPKLLNMQHSNWQVQVPFYFQGIWIGLNYEWFTLPESVLHSDTNSLYGSINKPSYCKEDV